MKTLIEKLEGLKSNLGYYIEGSLNDRVDKAITIIREHMASPEVFERLNKASGRVDDFIYTGDGDEIVAPLDIAKATIAAILGEKIK